MTTNNTDDRELPPFHLVRLGQLVEQFQTSGASFTHAMISGGGIRNLNILEMIRDLEKLYLSIGAQLQASRAVVKGQKEISLDDGLDALEFVRLLDQQNAAKEENSEEGQTEPS